MMMMLPDVAAAIDDAPVIAIFDAFSIQLLS